MSDNYSLIRQATLERKQIRAVYKSRVRELCPHALGRKAGRLQALFFQFGGGSERGLPPGGDWRCLPVDELTDVSIHEGAWHSGTGYGRAPQTCVGEIDVAVPVGG